MVTLSHEGVNVMKPMLLTYQEHIPQGKEWYFEIKYDGFRAILMIDKKMTMTSRNEKELLPIFPEISHYLESTNFHAYTPLKLDGELVFLINEGKADFTELQWRGRLRNEKTIQKTARQSPCRFLAFDLLIYKGRDVTKEPFYKRKQLLKKMLTELVIPLKPTPNNPHLIQYVPEQQSGSQCLHSVKLYDGEGIVAKSKNSIWEEGRRSKDWLKVKNWHTVQCFITRLHKENSYVTVGVYREEEIVEIGQVKNGMSSNDQSILRTLIAQNASSEDAQYYYLHPSICMAVHFLHIYEEHELRESFFSNWLLHLPPQECTWEQFTLSQFTFPEQITITSPEKPLWMINQNPILKIEFLHYIRELSVFLLPFLAQRALTIIRYPHGTLKEDRFFQKNKPDYEIPDYVQTYQEDEHEFIICNCIETLLWLGNQLALEFHIPFQKVNQVQPDEIVLDLDPANIHFFSLAIKAAQEIKKVLDSLKIISFIKTSGNKGLQVHIPLPEQTFSYQQTRIFTDFLGQYLTNQFPLEFTTERMKKNRGNRLYLDFVQHAEGKTIIAPYSTRGNSFAGVATPLYWEEVKEDLKLTDYTIQTVPKRVKRLGCPFQTYRQVQNQVAFEQILAFLSKNKNNLNGLF